MLIFFYADPGIFLSMDPEWEKFGFRIREKHPGSTTLIKNVGKRFTSHHLYQKLVWKEYRDLF